MPTRRITFTARPTTSTWARPRPTHAFLEEIAEALAPYKAILIAGPGTARAELAGYLGEHHPVLAKRIWGIEPMDHPTEPQIIAAARKYLHAADRMRS